MKKLLFLGLCSVSVMFAAESSEEKKNNLEPISKTTNYLEFGVGPLPIPFPLFGLGVRHQSDHIGFDASVQAASLIFTTALKENVDFLYFPKPNLDSQFYLGCGVGATQLIHRHSNVFFSPQFVFGKEYTNEAKDRRFIQMRTDFPLFYRKGRMSHTPAVVLSYGICF